MALHVALIEPQIPPNTGNIARLCAATDIPLHLIEPLGFSLDDADVRRAGLDYWDEVDLWVHPDWFAFRDAMDRSRCLYFSANAERSSGGALTGQQLSGVRQRDRGHAAADPGEAPRALFHHPDAGPVRSLNLATAVGIVLYEALRQTTAPGFADTSVSRYISPP